MQGQLTSLAPIPSTLERALGKERKTATPTVRGTAAGNPPATFPQPKREGDVREGRDRKTSTKDVVELVKVVKVD